MIPFQCSYRVSYCMQVHIRVVMKPEDLHSNIHSNVFNAGSHLYLHFIMYSSSSEQCDRSIANGRVHILQFMPSKKLTVD